MDGAQPGAVDHARAQCHQQPPTLPTLAGLLGGRLDLLPRDLTAGGTRPTQSALRHSSGAIGVHRARSDTHQAQSAFTERAPTLIRRNRRSMPQRPPAVCSVRRAVRRQCARTRRPPCRPPCSLQSWRPARTAPERRGHRPLSARESISIRRNRGPIPRQSPPVEPPRACVMRRRTSSACEGRRG